MKAIRQSCFETNSSSTHSLCIQPEGWSEYNKNCDFDNPYDNYRIELKSLLEPKYYDYQTAVITTTNYYKRGDGFYLIQGDLHKIQFLLSSMVSEGDIFTTTLKGNQLEKFQQIYKTIAKYLKNKYGIDYIKINQFDTYSDGYIVNWLCGWDWQDSEFTLEQIEEIILKIISDDSLVFTCHSDESGPFPEDIGLTEVELVDFLLKEDIKETENENNSEK
jgi:hypothetical protein